MDEDNGSMIVKGKTEVQNKSGVPYNPVIILIASSACKFPITPVTAPNMPVSLHDPRNSGAGGFGKMQR